MLAVYKVQLVGSCVFHVIHTSEGVKYTCHIESAKATGRIPMQILCLDEIFIRSDIFLPFARAI